jgi:hypothetical protein
VKNHREHRRCFPPETPDVVLDYVFCRIHFICSLTSLVKFILFASEPLVAPELVRGRVPVQDVFAS